MKHRFGGFGLLFSSRFAKNDFMYPPPNPVTAGAPLFFSIIAKVFSIHGLARTVTIIGA
jgi:hypothetical protein